MRGLLQVKPYAARLRPTAFTVSVDAHRVVLVARGKDREAFSGHGSVI